MKNPTRLEKQIKKIVKDMKREIQDVKTSDIFTLACDICSEKKVKLDGNDFEQWDKDLFNKEHSHFIRRFIRRWKKYGK